MRYTVLENKERFKSTGSKNYLRRSDAYSYSKSL